MKKVFILTGEPSGDKLASKVIIRTIDYLIEEPMYVSQLDVRRF